MTAPKTQSIISEFHYSDGKSNKFWRISLADCSHTAQYGKIGTKGQSKTKEFPTSEEAKKSCEKLIQEKLKKGYAEVEVDSSVSASVPQTQSNSSPTSPEESGEALSVDASPSEPQESEETKAESKDTLLKEDSGKSNQHLEEPAKRIDLNPEDWLWATWRPYTPLQRPESKPFDKEAALKHLTRKIDKPRYGPQGWSKVEIPIVMSPEEALFWLAAMTEISSAETIETLINRLKQWSFTDSVSLEQLQAILYPDKLSGRYHHHHYWPTEILLPLTNLLSSRELVDLLLVDPENPDQNILESLVPISEGFRRYVLPYLTSDERQQLQERLLPELDSAHWDTSKYHHRPPEVFFLAAALGMSTKLLTLVESWLDDTYIGKENYLAHYKKPQEIIFGLDSANLVETQIRRLKLPLFNSTYIRAWLAHTEYSALDWVCESILMASNKEEAQELLETFTLVKAPEAAPFMLDLQQSSKAPQVARQWLDENLAHGIQGLIPVAQGRGKLADAAVDWLQIMQRRGYGDLIQTYLNQIDEPEELTAKIFVETDYTLFDEQTTPEWLEQAIAELKKSKTKPPNWIEAADLPPIQIGELGLNSEQMAALLLALKQSQLDQPHDLIKPLKQQANSESLDQFAWNLFERWLAEGAPSKEKWAMFALGLLGSDAIALKLTPLVKVWPGESQHPRAVLGLQCLRAIGTDTALMQINGIAQKLKYKGLKAKAQECMEQIAQDRGLTREQLEDRIVPDCDLDERGTRTFDFGPRQFQFVLGENMKPIIRDAAGKVKPNLPKPGVKDNTELAEQAVADWKLIKKQISDLVKIQAVRLEQSMVQGRHWPIDEFETLLVHHPLMINLVRLLIWGGYDSTGELIQTFRVTEDQTYGDAEDEEIELLGVSQVGIIHPLNLSDEIKNTWGELLSDYEILPPFPQLGRATHQLEPQELESAELTQFKDLKIPAVSIVGTLEKLSWIRGMPQDAGIFDLHYKQFESANVTAVLGYNDGIPVGYMDGWDDQTLESCYFISGLQEPKGYWFDDRRNNTLKLGKVDPVVISEVLGDLNALAAKAK